MNIEFPIWLEVPNVVKVIVSKLPDKDKKLQVEAVKEVERLLYRDNYDRRETIQGIMKTIHTQLHDTIS